MQCSGHVKTQKSRGACGRRRYPPQKRGRHRPFRSSWKGMEADGPQVPRGRAWEEVKRARQTQGTRSQQSATPPSRHERLTAPSRVRVQHVQRAACVSPHPAHDASSSSHREFTLRRDSNTCEAACPTRLRTFKLFLTRRPTHSQEQAGQPGTALRQATRRYFPYRS